MSFVYRSVFIAGFIFMSAISVSADTIYKKDESLIKGLLVEQHYDRVVVSTPKGEKIVFKKDI